MARVTEDEQRELILALTNLGAGQAEAEDSELHDKRFYPVPEHIRAFESAVTLVVGDRGSGKSALFRTVFENDLLGVVARHAPHVRLPQITAGGARWLPAHPVGREFPDSRGLQAFMRHHPQDAQRAVDFWLAYLVRVVAGDILPAHQQAIAPILAVPAADPAQVHDAFVQAGAAPLIALDALDRHLRDDNGWLFVGYDELDTLGGFDTVITPCWAALTCPSSRPIAPSCAGATATSWPCSSSASPTPASDSSCTARAHGSRSSTISDWDGSRCCPTARPHAP
jgi:hypothetical protein